MAAAAIVLTTGLQVSPHQAWASEPISGRAVTSVVERFAVGDGFMGAVLVASGDATLFNGGYGQANAEWKIPSTPRVRYPIGSLTKQFTAAAVLLLQEDGKIDVNDEIGRYLPDIPEEWQHARIVQILGHNAGLPDWSDDPDFQTWSMKPQRPSEVIGHLRDKPLLFPPGTRFHYSNIGYLLLGLLIESVSGETYGQFLQQRILTPLEMEDSGLDSDEAVVLGRAEGYSFKNGRLSRARPMSITVGWSAGAMYSTTEDLWRWERALFGGKLLNASSLRAMTTAGPGRYGLGVNIRSIGGATVIGHGGAFQGFNASLTYIPSSKITIVVLSNVDTETPVVDAMTIGLVKEVLRANPATDQQSPRHQSTP